MTHHFLQGASGVDGQAEFKIELGEASKFGPCDEVLEKLARLNATGGANDGETALVAQIVCD